MRWKAVSFRDGSSRLNRLTDCSVNEWMLNVCVSRIMLDHLVQHYGRTDAPMICAIHDFRLTRLAIAFVALLAVLVNTGLTGDPAMHPPGNTASCHGEPSHTDHKSKAPSCVICIGCALETYGQTPVWKEAKQILAVSGTEVMKSIDFPPLRKPPRSTIG